MADGTGRDGAVAVLTKARALIDTPEKWAKLPNDANAQCASNAIALASRNFGFDAEYEARDFLSKAAGLPHGCRFVFEWNDAPERTHADVMAAFDKAIALARALPPTGKEHEEREKEDME